MVARLDGTLEFLSLAVPTRPSLNLPLQESSPIKRSSPRVTRKSSPQPISVPAASNNEGSPSVSVSVSHAYSLPDSPLYKVSHKLRAHHQPISVLGVMEGRIITGSHDRTLKVNGPSLVLIFDEEKRFCLEVARS